MVIDFHMQVVQIPSFYGLSIDYSHLNLNTDRTKSFTYMHTPISSFYAFGYSQGC